MRLPRRLPRRLTLPGVLAISAVVGAFFAFNSIYAISFAPPGVQQRHVTVGLAATHILLDAPDSLITKKKASSYDYDGYSKRAALYGNLIASAPVADEIARKVDITPSELYTRARLTLPVMWAMRDPDFEQRANQIVGATRPYKLELQSDPDNPILNIYAEAPSAELAKKLADASVTALREYLDQRSRTEGIPNDIVMSQLGAARGAVSNGQTLKQIFLLTFLVGFGVSFGVLLGLRRIRRDWILAGRASDSDDAEQSRPRAVARRVATVGGNWPHTTRVMPWLIAGFIALLWLVPFNAIQLSVSMPIDMKLDRLVLPLLFVVWILSLAAGGPESPRLRMTLIHVGIACFVAVASLSVVINAHDLNQTLEFDLSFKKITLLLSYVMMFVIIASSVRRAEVPAFLKYTLVLAVICAAGTIWEYRFHYNVFYDLADRLLPGFFTVGSANVGALDDIGRVMTLGPSDHPLEVTGMLTMALPIALVGIIHSPVRRDRILYIIAACFLLAAAISTYRKSALLGPVAVVLTIAYFRRRELLRLAPFGFISLVAIHTLSPGALGSIVFQLQPSRLGVATVSDRAADYDAVRPDVWSHLIWGRGYGSYDHLSYRVLDSEMLSRLVDTGILGVIAVTFMFVSMVIAGRKIINSRHPQWAPLAIAVAASAMAFLVLAFLFDVTSFPHVPYILLSLAGMLAVVVSSTEAEQPAPRPRPVDEIDHGPDAAPASPAPRERVLEPVGR